MVFDDILLHDWSAYHENHNRWHIKTMWVKWIDSHCELALNQWINWMSRIGNLDTSDVPMKVAIRRW